MGLKGKIILVTGSAGFVGFHTAKKLLDDGAIVVGADNFNDYYDPGLKEARNKILEGYPNYKIYRGDLSDPKFVEKIFTENKFDKICHLAAQAGVRYSLINPQSYVKSNIVAFVNILEAVRNNNIKDFVYASSSSVYGNNKKVPFSVDDQVNEPISLYAATKKADELMAYTYHHLFGINTTGLRFFTVIGPWGRPDMAPMIFADSIGKGKEIKVFNFGKMRRDFTYVEDVAEGVILSLEMVGGYHIFNLGNNKPVGLEYFISCLEKELGKKAMKKYTEIQPGDVLETYADIEYTEKNLGWKPKTSVEKAVNLFIDWYKEYFKI
ncbi:MAG TPA: GDP-mannose 4,6-dehydratase [Candidatus Paceibacterota bacterium]|nr:GDP-mannose 4,6-dehydratase [Candidatus Paceibacterota bacterium]HRZ34657.1 GDP-mannose 4,6-dehydratase [Candidatus Paceibacterota bacterium]